jgi:chromosome segregation ATPase
MPSDIGGAESHADAVKIAKHLSGVNSVLESENKELKAMVDGLRAQIDKSEVHHDLSAVGGELQSPSFRSIRQSTPGDLSEIAAKSRHVTEDGTIEMSPAVKDLITELSERVQDLEAVVDSKDARINELETSLGQSMRGPEHAEQRQELENKLAELQRLEVEQAEQVQALVTQLATSEQEFRNRIADHAKEFQEIVAEKDLEMETAAKEAAAKVERLHMENEGLIKEKDRLRSVLESDNVEEKERKLQDQIKSLEAEISKERSANSELRTTITSLQEELAFNDEELGRGEETLRDMQQKLDEANTAADEAEEKVEQLTAQLKTKVQEVSDMTESNRALTQKLKEAQEVQTTSAQTHWATQAELQNKLDVTSADLAAAVARASQVSSQLEQAREDLTAKQEEAAKTHAALQAEQEAHKATHNRLASVQSLLNAKSSGLDSPRSSQERSFDNVIAQMQHELAEAADIIERLQREKSTVPPQAKAELDAKEMRIEALEQEKSDLQGRVRSLRLQIENVQRTPVRAGVASMAAGSPCFSELPINKRLINLQTPKTPGSFAEVSFRGVSKIIAMWHF